MGLQITVSQRGAAMLGKALFFLGIAYIYYRACLNAYDIRLYAINTYGTVIHEFGAPRPHGPAFGQAAVRPCSRLHGR